MMKCSIQVLIIFLLSFMVSCAADSSEKVVVKESITKTTPSRTQNQATGLVENSQNQNTQNAKPLPNKATAAGQNTADRATQASKPSTIKAKYNAGTANHLGGQLGSKLCQCLKSENKASCEKINERINAVKQSMNPEILSIFEKAFVANKEEC